MGSFETGAVELKIRWKYYVIRSGSSLIAFPKNSERRILRITVEFNCGDIVILKHRFIVGNERGKHYVKLNVEKIWRYAPGTFPSV